MGQKSSGKKPHSLSSSPWSHLVTSVPPSPRMPQAPVIISSGLDSATPKASVTSWQMKHGSTPHPEHQSQLWSQSVAVPVLSCEAMSSSSPVWPPREANSHCNMGVLRKKEKTIGRPESRKERWCKTGRHRDGESSDSASGRASYHLQLGGDGAHIHDRCREIQEGVGAPAEQQRPGRQSGVHLRRDGRGREALTCSSWPQPPMGRDQVGTHRAGQCDPAVGRH